MFCLASRMNVPFTFFWDRNCRSESTKDDTSPDLLALLIAAQSPGVSRSIVVPLVQEGLSEHSSTWTREGAEKPGH